MVHQGGERRKAARQKPINIVEIQQGLFYRPWIQMGLGKITDWSLWLSHKVLKKEKKVAQIHCIK